MIGNSGGSAAQQMAFQWIQGMQTPSQELALAKLFGYLPPKPAVAKTYVQQEGAEWSVYANQTLYAHPRTLGLGTKYPKVSEAVWTAIQAAISGVADSEMVVFDGSKSRSSPSRRARADWERRYARPKKLLPSATTTTRHSPGSPWPDGCGRRRRAFIVL